MRCTDLFRRGLGRVAVAAAMLASCAQPVFAFPERPIQFLVGFSAGGPLDIAARTLAPFLERHLGGGANIVVVNKPGAGGEIALVDLINSRPDGHTVGMVTTPAFISLSMERRVRYTLDSFDYIAMYGDDAATLYVRADSPIKSLADLVAFARQRQGGPTIATAGLGNSMHIMILNFARMADMPLTWVPVRGGADVRTNVLGGHVDLGTVSASTTMPLHREGVVRVLGIARTERWNLAPDVPTFLEQGFRLIGGSNRGIAGPRGMPEAIRKRWEDAIRATVADPEFQQVATREFIALEFRDGAAFRAHVDEMARELAELWRVSPWRR
ncbi:MAG: tripartite tricarboxylate transporter substrate binding protein [Alphaproteobacteria bacterium]|nr:tripartite tricarboxylate transporter substrate binding protein [Alphaproteobacteria bacterium]